MGVDTFRATKRVLDPLKLELQVFMGYKDGFRDLYMGFLKQ